MVENKPGANNQLAAEYIVNSPPDGHTLFIAPDGTFVANPSLYPKLPYDPYKSFTPISGLMIINHGLIEHPSFPPNNVKELIALAKQKPGEINYGTYGIGSSGHLNMVLLETMTGLKLQAVHYKGAAPVMNDVLAGHIQMGFVSAGSAVPQMEGRHAQDDRGRRQEAHPAAAGRSDRGGDRAGLSRRCRGSACSARPACRPTWWRRSTRRSARCSPIRNSRRRSSTATCSSRSRATPEELMTFIKSEEPKWRKIIQDAKIKVNAQLVMGSRDDAERKR